jgi:PAS domain S-box-containing protein
MVEAAAAPMFALDRKGHVRYWNGAVEALTGTPASSVRDRYFPDTSPVASDAERWYHQILNISFESPVIHISNYWQIHDGSVACLTSRCVLIPVGERGDELIVCSIANSGPGSERRLFSELAMNDRAAEHAEIARFLHDTISQDLVQLSLLIDRLDSPKQSFTAPGRDQASDILERCCRSIRVMGAMLTPVPHEASFEAWIEEYARFLREETGIFIDLDLDPLPVGVPPPIKLLVSTTVQMWVAKAVRISVLDSVVVRTRERANALTLELEISCQYHPHPAEGWSLICERAEALGGRFEVSADNNCTSARLRIPHLV